MRPQRFYSILGGKCWEVTRQKPIFFFKHKSIKCLAETNKIYIKIINPWKFSFKEAVLKCWGFVPSFAHDFCWGFAQSGDELICGFAAATAKSDVGVDSVWRLRQCGCSCYEHFPFGSTRIQESPSTCQVQALNADDNPFVLPSLDGWGQTCSVVAIS